jgi:hypothetical protein
MGDGIRIKGAGYKATNTQDGYFTVHDVPLASEVKQGVKNAPNDIGKEELQSYVDTAQRKYHDGHLCARAFKRHNPDPGENAPEPEFAGFVLPKHVGRYKFDDGERWTAFGDLKLTAEKFEEFKAGKLPHHSPEIHWGKERITGLAFLDAQDPYFEYSTNTVSEVVENPQAAFAAVDDVAKFMADDPTEEEEMNKKELEALFGKFAEQTKKTVEEAVTKTVDEAVEKKFASMNKKPDVIPVEPTTNKEGAKMKMDPEFAAKFAALQNDNAEVKAKLEERENKEQAAELVAGAEAALTGKSITQPLREQIASFAAEAVQKEGGQAWFGKFIDSLKTSIKDKPPTSLTEFHAQASTEGTNKIDPSTNPDLAQYVNEGPEALDQAAKFMAQARAIKTSPVGGKFSFSEKDFVKEEMRRWKAIRSGELQAVRPE